MLTIHRYWTGDKLPPTSSPMAGRIASHFGDVTDWTDETLPLDVLATMKEHEGKVPPNERAKQRSNIARLALLRKFGGLWIDHDVILMRPVNTHYAWAAKDGELICSAALFFPAPEDDRLAIALAAIKRALHARSSSGEEMLEDVWPDLLRVPFTFGFDGSPQSTDPWAIHLWSSRRWVDG